jgi:hypothetical protein
VRTEPRPEGDAWAPLRRLISSTPTTLGVVASLITILALGFGIYRTQTGSKDSVSASSEAKQMVAFHQWTNRICTENQMALSRAVPEAHSRVQLLAFLARGTGWGINDLESVVPPESLKDRFPDEISVRQQIQEALLDIQRAGETGDLAAKSEAAAAVGSAEEAAAQVDREMGLRRCAPVLPTEVKGAISLG